MEELGHLAHLYTGYPRFKAKDLPQSKVSSFPWLMGPYMALGRIGLGPALRRLDHSIHISFDNWACRNLQPCDVYHCMSGVGLRTHQAARQRYGAITVCDRASTHILYQQEILREEFERWGVLYPRFDNRIVERELAEYELCDIISVPSEVALRSFLEHKVSAQKLRKNPFGVNLDMFRREPKRDDVFRVLFVGQICLRKGIPYLLEALAPIQLPRFEFCLAGTILPEIRPLLSRYEGRFRYLGVLPHDELYRLYSQASVFVLPSIEEGLAYVQAEAMACGLPVIATPNTGAEDLFADGVEGFVVPIRNSEAIRERTLALYHNPELGEQMSRDAHTRVRSMRGWNHYGKRAAQIYLEQSLPTGGRNFDASSSFGE
jgi:glycosyltransferase involved in cell wall biosynthesis